MTYRSPDGHRFDQIYKQITELKKEVNKREQQKKAMADVIEQDSLVEVKGGYLLQITKPAAAYSFCRSAADQAA